MASSRRIIEAIWRAYGPLVTSVTEALFEFALFVLILNGSRKFLQLAAPALSCDSVVDCVHTGGFLIVWLALVLSFVGYAILFGYQRFKGRARQLLESPLEERLKTIDVFYPALVGALAAMAPTATFTDRSRALESLRVAKEALGDKGRLDRRINFFMGRLNRQMRQLDRAIQVLTDFIEEKEKQRQFDIDLADAYYNRSCYHIAKMNLTASEEDKQVEKALAYADLETSVKYNPQNRLDAQTDEDFDPIRGDQKFKDICGETK